jgi:hypothetical protein
MGCETGRLKLGTAAKGKEMTAKMKHDDWLFEQLKDAEFAAEFINAASEDDDPKS